MTLSLHLFGTFQATINGELIPATRTKRIEALLIYLAMEPAHAHRRETLVGLLFPELAEETARSNLRQTISRLQAASALPLRVGITCRIAYADFIGSPLHEEYTCYGRG